VKPTRIVLALLLTTACATTAHKDVVSGPAATHEVSDSSAGSTVKLAVGDRLHVTLPKLHWDAPVSSAPGVVVRRGSAGGYPSQQPVDATFVAVKAGSAEVTATADASCFHTTPRCMMAIQQWVLHVTVS